MNYSFTKLNGFDVEDATARVELDKKPYYFNTVADMKLATLKENDCVITLGYYAADDGGGGEYLVVNDNGLVDNGGTVHALTGGLKAQLINTDVINVKQFGANTSVQDSSSFIQTAINYGGKIFFPAGTYKISTMLSINSNNVKAIVLDENATIKATSSVEAILKLTTGTDDLIIKGGKFDCNSLAERGIYLYGNAWGFNLSDIKITNATVYGLSIGKEDSPGQSLHGYMHNIKLYNQSTLATCLGLFTHDVSLTDCEMFYTDCGIENKCNNQFLNNIHIWAGGASNSHNNTLGIKSTGSNLYLTNCYFDGNNVAVKAQQGIVEVTNSYFLFPDEGTYNNPICFLFGANAYLRLNNYIVKPKNTLNVALLDYYESITWDNLSSFKHNIQYYDEDAFDRVFVSGNLDLGANINISQNKQQYVFLPGSVIKPNKYYLIGAYVLPSVGRGGNRLSFEMHAQNAGVSRLFELAFDYSVANGFTQTAVKNTANFSNSDTRYKIVLGNPLYKSTNNGNSVRIMPIYFNLGIRDTNLTTANGLLINAFDKNRTDGCILFFKGVEFDSADIWKEYTPSS